MINRIIAFSIFVFISSASYAVSYHDTRYDWSYDFKSGARVEGYFVTNSYYDDNDNPYLDNTGDFWHTISDASWSIFDTDGSYIGSDSADHYRHIGHEREISQSAHIAKNGSKVGLSLSFDHDGAGLYSSYFDSQYGYTSAFYTRPIGSAYPSTGTWSFREAGNDGWKLLATSAAPGDSPTPVSVPDHASTVILLAGASSLLALAKRKFPKVK